MNNIITASFGCLNRCVTAPAYRIDRGMILQFAGVELPAIYEVHFSHSRNEEATIVLGDADGVEIPDTYFNNADKIYAWVYITPEEGVGYTEYEVEIPLISRPNTTDVQPTPEEESIIDQAIYTLNNAVETYGGLVAKFNGEIFSCSGAVTERVSGGTWLKNQLWANLLCATVGYYYNTDDGRMYLYGLACAPQPTGGHSVNYRMLWKDNPDEPTEMTIDDDEHASAWSGDYDHFKWRVSISSFDHHFDFRTCHVRYDADGNEVDRIYSTQYRYTVENGVATRTEFVCEEQSPDIIIDVGYGVSVDSVRRTLNYNTLSNPRRHPLVSTFQSLQYDFIIPDERFDNAPYGLALVAKMGDNSCYYGPTFDKAKPSLPYLPAEDGTYTLRLVMSNGEPTLSWV